MVFIDEKQFKANLHCHSTESDGTYTVEYLKQIYKEKGYQILAATEHERPLDHTNLNDPDFLFLTGYEAYIRLRPDGKHDGFLPEMHLNLFAREHDRFAQIWPTPTMMKYYRDPVEKENHAVYGPTEPRILTVENVNRFIALAKEYGYLVVYNHPAWSLESGAEILRYPGLLSMEICNGNSFTAGHPEYNGAIFEYLHNHGYRIFCHAADDNHNSSPLDNPGCDSFRAFTMFNLRDGILSYENVIRALEEGTYYASQGPLIHHLEIDGDHVYIRTSPVKRISLRSNGQHTRNAFAAHEGETITEAEFTIPKRATFIRFNICDNNNLFADSQVYYPGEHYFLPEEA